METYGLRESFSIIETVLAIIIQDNLDIHPFGALCTLQVHKELLDEVTIDFVTGLPEPDKFNQNWIGVD